MGSMTRVQPRLAGAVGWRLACALLVGPGVAAAQESEEELAKKLSNPVSSMISVPLQWNYDCCYGPNDGQRLTLNVQPVVPFRLSDDWNLIVRTIMPIVYQGSPAPGVGAQSGVSDITQSFFFAPEAKDGLTWAVGPVFLWPVGTEELGTQKWGAGPTALVLKQDGPASFGLLANHIWSYAGDEDRDDVNQTFLQPFYSYTTKSATTYGLNLESTYNWETKTWSIPLNMTITKVYKFGEQRVSIGAGARVHLEDEPGAPEWGLRAIATFLFPD